VPAVKIDEADLLSFCIVGFSLTGSSLTPPN